ncbi:hypothetical protein AAG906_038342 [Vitis piasezkii]
MGRPCTLESLGGKQGKPGGLVRTRIGVTEGSGHVCPRKLNHPPLPSGDRGAGCEISRKVERRPDSKWNNQKQARSNKLDLMFMRMTIANNIKTSLPQTEFHDKSLAGTLMAELTTMKYDGQKGIQQHILNMTEKAAKLKALGMGMDESFLVHDQWNLNELTSKCIQEEVRLRQEGHNLALVVTHGVMKKKGKFKKGKNFPPKKSGPGEGSQSHDGKFTVSCYFYGKKGHVKKDCIKCKAWIPYNRNQRKVKSSSIWEIEKYFITFLDDLSRYGYVYLMHEKTRAIDILRYQIEAVNIMARYDELRQNPSPLPNSLKSVAFVLSTQYSTPYLKTAMYTLNKVPSKAVPKTPFELWTGRKPSLRHIYIWGCPAEARIYNPHEKKLDSRTISGYFIGYPDKSKGYRFYCPNHGENS